MKLQPGHIKREVSWKGAILQDWRCCDAVKTYETPQKHHGNLCGLLLSCRIEISSFAALRASDAFTAMVCSILYLENWAEGWSVKTFKFTKFKQPPGFGVARNIPFRPWHSKYTAASRWTCLAKRELSTWQEWMILPFLSICQKQNGHKFPEDQSINGGSIV